MRKITLLMAAMLMTGLTGGLFAQTSGTDNCEYVDHKNTGGTGYHILEIGQKEKAAQTYHYSGPGRVERVYLMGDNPGSASRRLRIGIYNVDGSGRPTSVISQQYYTWQGSGAGTRSLGVGNVPVSNDFAIVVEYVGFWIGWPVYDWVAPQGSQFNIGYTGDGEGNGEDLAAMAGTSTGGNWTSIISDDGDYYIYPRMRHYNTADFGMSSQCIATGGTVDFTNTSTLTQDEMFNTITHPDYAGSDFVYAWDFGDGSPVDNTENPSHTFAMAGVYTVTLTTTIGRWPMSGTSTITDTKTMKVSVGLDVSGVGTNLSCFESGDGEIDLTATGGDASNYTYMITNDGWQSGTNFNGLDAGTNDIYVQDALGCEAQGTAIVLTEPTAIAIADPIGITEATCGNADGGLLVAASGGTGTLEYSNDGGSNFQATGAFSNLNSGTYHIVVEDDNNCQADTYVTIDNNAGPSLTVQSQTNISCNGGTDGTITMIGSGGTGALEYSVDGTNWQATGSFTGLAAGHYIPQVRDAAGCITSSCNPTVSMCGIELTEPTAITFGLEATDALCNGSSDGEIDVVNAIGGIGTITYSADGTNYQSGTNFTGFAAGSHTITVKDAAGCTATGMITVGEPTAVTVSILSTTDVSCYGETDGAVGISAGGGVGGFEYSINDNDFYPTGEFEGLEAGVYPVTVEDANGCQATTTATINEPTEITLSSFVAGAATCGTPNGTIAATAIGGSGSGYLYSIDGGMTTNSTGAFSGLASDEYYLLVEDGDGCTASFAIVVTSTGGTSITGTTQTNVTCNGGSNGTVTVTATSPNGGLEYSVGGANYQTGNTITDLSGGTNVVVVTDALGCLDTAIVTLTEPAPFTINLTETNVSCNGGSDGEIDIAAAGGSGTLAYSIDGTGFQSSTNFSGLMAGDYTVTVKDAGQCTGDAMVTITEPTEITIVSAELNVTCYGDNDGSINAVANGGTGAITYSIDGTSFQANGLFTSLTAGSYSVIAKDANNCLETQIVVVSEPDELVLSANVSDVSCAGGSDGVVDLTVAGGTTPMMYTWSNGIETEDIFNLLPGNYSVIVRDANGCTATDNWDVIQPSNPIIINGTVTDATGATNNDGEVDITVTGGTPAYSYSWSNAATTEDIFALLPGVYVVTVTDANNCSMQASFTVDFVLGLDEEAGEFSMDIYPNPARDIVNIVFGTTQTVKNIALLDITGKVVYEEIPTNNFDKEFEININFLPEGVYFARVQTNDQIVTKKIVVSK